MRRQTALDDEQKEHGSSLERQRPSLPDTDALLPFASIVQSQPLWANPCLLKLLKADSSSFSLPHSIIFPLSQIVCDLFDRTDTRGSDLSSMVIRLVFSGVPIWQDRSRSVVQVGDNVVVKIGQHLDHDEHGTLQFLEEHFPSISAPRALGLIIVGPTSFMFMTMIPGTTLEARWPSLSIEAKTHIRRILDNNLLALRKLELPHGAPFGSPTGRRVCKDVRRSERVNTSPIYSETQFNEFLLASPSSRAAPSYKSWLCSMLRVDHRIVFSHADFHPRNIMVVNGLNGLVELSGILDWEFSGFYPEYWERLKALNTRSIKDTNDWWDYLPPSILGYDHEVLLDQVIESTVIY